MTNQTNKTFTGALWELAYWNSLSTTRVENLSGTLLTAAGQVAQGPAFK